MDVEIDGDGRLTDDVQVAFRSDGSVGPSTLVAATLGIVASLLPSIAAARMSVVEGLKTLD